MLEKRSSLRNRTESNSPLFAFEPRKELKPHVDHIWPIIPAVSIIRPYKGRFFYCPSSCAIGHAFGSGRWGGLRGGGGARLRKIRVTMIHRFMTSHPVAEFLLCFYAKHQDGRPMLFGFFVILTHRLMELSILNPKCVEKVYSRPFKQMS